MSVKCMGWAWEVPVKSTAKLVLLALADWACDDGSCWPGQRTIAEKCGITDRCVRSVLAEMTEMGFVIREHRHRADGTRASDLTRLAVPWSVPENYSDLPEAGSGGYRNEVPGIYTSVLHLSVPTERVEQGSTLPVVAPIHNHTGTDGEQARALFDYWRERCGHPRAAFSQTRRRKVIARLREGYTVDQLRRAVDGAAANPHRDNGVTYDDLELICRSAEKVDLFIQRAGGSKEAELAAWDRGWAEYEERQREQRGET